MRGEWFQFRTTFKLWLATNHLPKICGADQAIWDRIVLIPFHVRIANPDKELEGKLGAEQQGMLQCAIEGCLAWQTEGLGRPSEVTEAISRYRADMDAVGRFLQDRCDCRPSTYTTWKDLYVAYRNWCDVYGEIPLSSRELGIRLEQRGIVTDKGTRGVAVGRGVQLLQ